MKLNKILKLYRLIQVDSHIIDCLKEVFWFLGFDNDMVVLDGDDCSPSLSYGDDSYHDIYHGIYYFRGDDPHPKKSLDFITGLASQVRGMDESVDKAYSEVIKELAISDHLDLRDIHREARDAVGKDLEVIPESGEEDSTTPEAADSTSSEDASIVYESAPWVDQNLRSFGGEERFTPEVDSLVEADAGVDESASRADQGSKASREGSIPEVDAIKEAESSASSTSSEEGAVLEEAETSETAEAILSFIGALIELALEDRELLLSTEDSYWEWLKAFDPGSLSSLDFIILIKILSKLFLLILGKQLFSILYKRLSVVISRFLHKKD